MVALIYLFVVLYGFLRYVSVEETWLAAAWQHSFDCLQKYDEYEYRVLDDSRAAKEKPEINIKAPSISIPQRVHFPFHPAAVHHALMLSTNPGIVGVHYYHL